MHYYTKTLGESDSPSHKNIYAYNICNSWKYFQYNGWINFLIHPFYYILSNKQIISLILDYDVNNYLFNEIK